MMGPADRPAMEINGSADPISLTLSPAVVRLIIHAVQTLIPAKVGHWAGSWYTVYLLLHSLQEVKVEEAPRDLWVKQLIFTKKYWFLESGL